MVSDEWVKKFKGDRERGGARIYRHPLLTRAIVENHYGVSYDGNWYDSVDEAKKAALDEMEE